MKKNKKLLTMVLISILAVGIITGCGKNPEEIQAGFLEMIESPADEAKVKETASYLDKNLKYMDTGNADELVIAYEDYAFAFDNTYLNYDDLADRYGKYISEALTELYRMKGHLSQAPATVDAVLQISWEELIERAVEVELYMCKYKDVESVKPDALRLYSNLVNSIIMGTTGSQVFDLATGNMKSEVKAAYRAAIKDNPDTQVQWVLKEYMTYLEEIDFNLNYGDPAAGEVFFNTCSYLVSEAGKRVYQ